MCKFRFVALQKIERNCSKVRATRSVRVFFRIIFLVYGFIVTLAIVDAKALL